jgi:hypothetical protein
MVLSRNGLLKSRRSNPRIAIGEQDFEEPKKVPSPYNEFKHNSSLILKFDVLSRFPIMIRQFKHNLLNVIYNDGFIQVIQYSNQLISPSQSMSELGKPVIGLTFLLGEFFAFHFPPSDLEGEGKNQYNFSGIPSNELLKNVLDASECETFGSNCYLEELFTVGYDLRIIHWGVRYNTIQDTDTVGVRVHNPTNEEKDEEKDEEASESSSADPMIYSEEVSLLAGDVPVAIDYLGEYNLHDPSMKGLYASAQNNPITLLSYLELLVTSLTTEKGRPLTKIITGNFGGSLFQLELIHPHLNIYSWKSLVKLTNDKPLTKNDARTNDLYQAISFAVRGPDLKFTERIADNLADYQFVQDSSVSTSHEKKEGQESTLIAMKSGILDIISIDSGRVLQSISLDHIKELYMPPNPNLTGLIRKDVSLARLEERTEIRPSIIHYCPYSQYILVGYCSGTIGVVMCSDTIQSMNSVDFSYLRTNEVHESEITLLKTFKFRYCANLYTDPIEGDKSKEIIVAVVGDSQGTLSLWQIFPQTKTRSPLIFQVRQHSGKLLHANICEIPTNVLSVNQTSPTNSDYNNKNILITSCDKGMTYAWRMERNLKLQIIAYYQSNHLPYKQTSFVAIPKMIYRKSILKGGNVQTLPGSQVLEKVGSPSLQMNSTDKGNVYNALFASKSISTLNSTAEMMIDFADKEIAVLSYEIYCIIGFADGFFEIWALSSDPRYCSDTPIISVQEMKMMISNISLYNPQCSSVTNKVEEEEDEEDEEQEDNEDLKEQKPKSKKPQSRSAPDSFIVPDQSRTIPNAIVREFCLVNQPYEEIETYEKLEYTHIRFTPALDQDLFLCGYKDGSMLLYRVTVNVDYEFENNKPAAVEGNVTPPMDDDSTNRKRPKRMILEKLSVFKFPTNLLSVIPYPIYENSLIPAGKSLPDWSFLFISDFNVYEFLPFVSENNVLPKKWTQTYTSFDDFFLKNLRRLKTFNNTRRPAMRSGVSKNALTTNYSATTLKLGKSPFATIAAASTESEQQLSQAGGTPLLVEGGGSAYDESNRSRIPSPQKIVPRLSPPKPKSPHPRISTARLSTGRESSTGSKRQYIGKMESMQRIMSAELHQAKKDKRLIELFTHQLQQSDGTVTSEQAIDIIYQWVIEYQSHKFQKFPKGAYPASLTSTITSERVKTRDPDDLTRSTPPTTLSNVMEIKRENLKELFHLLDINLDTDRLKFIEVAKVAAITMSAIEKSVSMTHQKQPHYISVPAGMDGDGEGEFSLDDSNINSAQPSENSSVSEPTAKKLGPSYKKLRTGGMKVTYNSMGEKVYEKVQYNKQQMGMPNGLLSTVKKMFYGHLQAGPYSPKGLNSAAESGGFTLPQDGTVARSKSPAPKKRKLKEVPANFQKLIAPKKFPSLQEEYFQSENKRNALWISTNLHYFDIVRTIRIARSILDMRSIEQYEILNNPSKNHHFSLLPDSWMESNQNNGLSSIPKLLITYFERQFGECSNNMNVTRYKVVNFLEACLQYSQYAIIHLFRHLLSLETDNDKHSTSSSRSNKTLANKGEELGVWLISEARNMLLSRGCVVVGGLIHPIDEMSSSIAGSSRVQLNNLDNISVASSLMSPSTFREPSQNNASTAAASDMRWQYVSKADALHVCDELLRIRGHFGPHMYVTILHLIDLLPSATLSHIMMEEVNVNPAEINPTAPKIVHNPNELMIDLEKFLEILFFEFLHQDYNLRIQNNLVFGEYAMNDAITAKARDINAVEKRELIIDDDTGVGPYHKNNLSRIKDILHVMIKYDPLRTGEIDPIIGHKLLVKILLDLTFHRGNVQRVGGGGAKYQDVLRCEKVVTIAKNKTKLSSIEAKLSYIDILAVFLAWEEQNQGVKVFSIDELVKTVESIERSIDTSLARDLIKYFTCVSAWIRYDNPLWTLGMNVDQSAVDLSEGVPSMMDTGDFEAKGEEGNRAELINRVVTPHMKKNLTQSSSIATGDFLPQEKKLSLPMGGNWKLPGNDAPSDLPGMLHVKPIVLEDNRKVNTNFESFTSIKDSYRNELEAHKRLAPFQYISRRDRTNAYGETSKAPAVGGTTTKQPVPIHINRLQDSADLSHMDENTDSFTDNQNNNLNSNYFALYTKDGEEPLRTSYSRVLGTMNMSSYVTEGFSPSPSKVNSRLPSPVYHLSERGVPAIQEEPSQFIVSQTSLSQLQEEDGIEKQPSLDLSKEMDDEEMNRYFDENNNFNLNYFITDSLDSVSKDEEELQQYIQDTYHNGDQLGDEQQDNISQGTKERFFPYQITKEDSVNSLDSNYQRYDLIPTMDNLIGQPSGEERQFIAEESYINDSQKETLSIEIDASEYKEDSPKSPKSPTNEPIEFNFIQSPPYVPRASPFQDKRKEFPQNPVIPEGQPLHHHEAIALAVETANLRLNPNGALTPFLPFSEVNPLNNMMHPSVSQLQASQSTLSQSHPIFQNSNAAPSNALSVSGTGYDLPSQDRVIQNELSSRVSQIAHLEKEFQFIYLQEEKNYLKRRLEKEKARNSLRRELYYKNKVGMDYYYKALEERYRRLNQGQQLLQLSLDREMKDKMAKEAEIQRILDQNRNRLLKSTDNKLSKEEMMKLKRQEEKETKLMRKEDKLSMEIRNKELEARLKLSNDKKALAEFEAQQLLKKRLEEEEEAERIRRTKSSYDEDDDDHSLDDSLAQTKDELEIEIPSNLASQSHEVPSSTYKKHRSKSMFGSLSQSMENYDPNAITPELTARKDEKPAEDIDETMSHDDSQTNDDSAPMTAIEEHLKILLNNIQNSLAAHAAHPRKLLKDGKYYIPLLFSDDLEFNPFNSNIPKMNDFILANIEKEKERQELESLSRVTSKDIIMGKSFQFSPSSPSGRRLSRTGSRAFSRSTSRDIARELRHSPGIRPEGTGGDDDEDEDETRSNKSGRKSPYGGGNGLYTEDEDEELSFFGYNAEDSWKELNSQKMAPNPFDDLTRTLKDYRKMNEKRRKLLFATDHSNVPLHEWTPVVKTSFVSWKQFFKKEKGKLEIIKQMGEALFADEDEDEDFENEDPLATKKGKQNLLEKSLLANLKSHSRTSDQEDEQENMSVSSGGSFLSANLPENRKGRGARGSMASLPDIYGTNSRSSFTRSASTVGQIPKTLLESLPKDMKKDIVPLPFGQILKKQKVYEGKLKFYQLEVFNPNSLLTIEIEMLKGSCELLVHKGKLPSTVKFQQKITCVAKKKRRNFSPTRESPPASVAKAANQSPNKEMKMEIATNLSSSNPPSPVLTVSPSPTGKYAGRAPSFISPAESSVNTAHPPRTFSPQKEQPLTIQSEDQDEDEGPKPNEKNDRLHRLVIEPEEPGTYFIAIHALSAPGTIYNLWAYLSGEREDGAAADPNVTGKGLASASVSTVLTNASSQNHLQRVDEIIKKWNILIDDNKEEDLLINFPKLEMEAGAKVQQAKQRKAKDNVKKREVIDEMKSLRDEGVLAATLKSIDKKLMDAKENKDNPDALVEIENLEKFVTKVGRLAIRKEREVIVKKTKEILDHQKQKMKLTSGASGGVLSPGATPHSRVTPKSEGGQEKSERFFDPLTQVLEHDDDKDIGIDFENLFDTNDAFLQNNNLLLHEMIEDEEQIHQLNTSVTSLRPFHHQPTANTGNNLLHINTAGESPRMASRTPAHAHGGHMAIGHAHLGEKFHAPPSFQHGELFTIADVHRSEKLMLLKPFNKTEEIDLNKEMEQFQAEQNFLEKQEQHKMKRQASSLPVLSLNFNTLKMNNEVVHSTPATRVGYKPRPITRFSEMMTAISTDSNDPNNTKLAPQIKLGSSSTPKLPQIALPKSVLTAYQQRDAPVADPKLPPKRVKRMSYFAANTASRDRADSFMVSSASKDRRDSFLGEYSLTPSEGSLLQHVPFQLEEDDEENEFDEADSPNNYQALFGSVNASQITSLPNSLAQDSSATSPVVNNIFDVKMNIDKKKKKAKLNEKINLQKNFLAMNPTPKVINYNLNNTK